MRLRWKDAMKIEREQRKVIAVQKKEAPRAIWQDIRFTSWMDDGGWEKPSPILVIFAHFEMPKKHVGNGKSNWVFFSFLNIIYCFHGACGACGLLSSGLSPWVSPRELRVGNCVVLELCCSRNARSTHADVHGDGKTIFWLPSVIIFLYWCDLFLMNWSSLLQSKLELTFAGAQMPPRS